MSCTNANGYILPIEDNYATQKFGSIVKHVADTTAADYTVTAATGTCIGTVTIAQLLNGFIVTTGVDAAPYTINTPLGAAISAAIPNVAVGTSFEVVISEAKGQQMTWASGGAGVTVVGTATLAASRASVAVFVCTAADTWKTFLVIN